MEDYFGIRTKSIFGLLSQARSCLQLIHKAHRCSKASSDIDFSPFSKLPISDQSMAFQTIKIATKRRTDSPEARRQQRERRRVTLFKKACEYSLDCDADVYIAIRIRKDDQIFTFNSDSTGEWPLSEVQIVRYSLSGSLFTI
jgi:hypothetical protein